MLPVLSYKKKYKEIKTAGFQDMFKFNIHTVLSATIVWFPPLSFLSFKPLKTNRKMDKWVSQNSLFHAYTCSLEGEKKLPLASQGREALDEQILYRKSARYEKGTAFISSL